MRKKIILFYNPKSGNGHFTKNIDYIIGRCQEAGYQLIPIRAAGEYSIADFFETLDQNTYKNEYRQIIAAGGDGTINICVNAMIEKNIDLPLAIMPAGTANDFAYYFNLSNDIERLMDIALGDYLVAADVGHVNEKYFINVAAIGQVVDVSQKTDPNLKNSIGALAYYLKGVSEFKNLKATKVTIVTPEKTYKEKMYFMVVMNGKSAGGFKNISPRSDIGDGKLDVILFRAMHLIEMPSVFFKALRGAHYKSKNVLSFQSSELKIISESDLPTDIDGEHGTKLPLTFKVLPNKLKIFASKDVATGEEMPMYIDEWENLGKWGL